MRNTVAAAHHFTIDVEEYFQVSALEPHVPRSTWDSRELRARASMEQLLRLLDDHEARCTCFVLGWLAEREPGLVRAIADAGHEIASHGWDHRRVTHQTPAEFRASIRETKLLLEDLTGKPVLGFRAPSFSIVNGREWALEILVEEGYTYDSSLVPVNRPGYGYSGGQRDPHSLETPSGPLMEFPPAVRRRFGMNLPAGGGAYLRLFPYAWIGSALRESGDRGVPATLYIHPWEWDPEQPRIPVPFLTRIRHYGGVGTTWSKLERMLAEFKFIAIAQTLDRRYDARDR